MTESPGKKRHEILVSAVRRSIVFAGWSLSLVLVFFLSACTELEKPAPEPFFARTNPPKKQEFRWSNGRLPKSLDPALAAAPPETDVVRAIYEGLTETDPSSLEAIAGVADSWSAKDDYKVWRFTLRKDAKWSNGRPVTAGDFVRSWKRLIAMGKRAANAQLLNNIVGVPASAGAVQVPAADDRILDPAPDLPVQQLARPSNVNAPPTQTVDSNTNTQAKPPGPERPELEKIGIAAEGDQVLRVTLIMPDKDFPMLVANPVFRPVFGDGSDLRGKELSAEIVTNGPFTISSIDSSGIVLDRSKSYWNRDRVGLERVHFVPMENAEKALSAYRSGELDAVTNADFAPLVLKLLSPYQDFRRATHSALNFYEVNSTKAPFSDRRVRQALSNAIEREKLTEGEMEGVTRPALNFFPFNTKSRSRLTQDKEKAKELLDEAGFPEGKDFPVIKLLVNRNDAQQRIARSVARMWKQTLNVETEIVVKETAELESARRSGEFDLIRRGVVLPTADAAANFAAIFETVPGTDKEKPAIRQSAEPSAGETPEADLDKPNGPSEPAVADAVVSVQNEDDALYELRAIPLYFPTSFSLVRPYVSGFEMNSLDVLTLSTVAIDNEWQPKSTGDE